MCHETPNVLFANLEMGMMCLLLKIVAEKRIPLSNLQSVTSKLPFTRFQNVSFFLSKSLYF